MTHNQIVAVHVFAVATFQTGRQPDRNTSVAPDITTTSKSFARRNRLHDFVSEMPLVQARLKSSRLDPTPAESDA